MARASKAQEIEQANEEAALAFFRGALASLPDPRRAQGTRYPLASVVVIALMSMVCGADNAEEMEDWGEANEEWLDGILDLPRGTPTQDVFLSVFAALDPAAFRNVFQEKRSVELCRDLGWLTTADRWPHLSCIVKVTRERTVLATEKTSTETAYYIGSPHLRHRGRRNPVLGK